MALSHSGTPPGAGHRRGALLLGVILVVLCLGTRPGPSAQEHGANPPAVLPAPAKPAHLQRGDEVEARYGNYRERLERFFETFAVRLQDEALDLHARLTAAPPAPVPYGYQILPKLVPGEPGTGKPSRIVSTSYSWPRTGGFIDRDLGRLERLEARLTRAEQMTGEDRRTEWAKTVDDYRALVASQKLTAAHIQHNRVWQADIARIRAAYDRATVLHDAVFQRQGLLDTLEFCDGVLEPYLWARQEALSGQIREATRKFSPSDFVRVEHPSSHRWIFRVPVYTDIEDRSFVEAFRSAAEAVWQLQDREDEFSVTLEIHYLTPGDLFGKGLLPSRGEHLDLQQHIRRFPRDGAGLTTGSEVTYLLGRIIVVGPQDITPNVLAHEVGHILGFWDGYIRGYRDRGPHGYEILELVIDPDDIMSEPKNGRIQRHHFQRLLDARGLRSP